MMDIRFQMMVCVDVHSLAPNRRHHVSDCPRFSLDFTSIFHSLLHFLHFLSLLSPFFFHFSQEVTLNLRGGIIITHCLAAISAPICWLSWPSVSMESYHHFEH